jgi:hypothetical protein
MPVEKKWKILYWVLTAPFVLMMSFAAFNYFMASPQVLQGMGHLGYPIYFLKILGTAKILGILAIVFGNRCQTLKEWAYAGFTFNLLAAAASHAFSGDDAMKIAAPLVFLVLLLSSYFIWKKKVTSC